MPKLASPASIAVLVSGGLDSAILTGILVARGERVRPIYVRTGCVWQEEELRATRGFLKAIAHARLAELTILDMPVADLYGDHWSVTGSGVPDLFTPDEAVYLPGRNPLLLLKPAIWCRMQGITRLALATLAANPFDDATPAFCSRFEAMIEQATGGHVEIVRPFAHLEKHEVVQLGARLPLELTFSCLRPVDGEHCGGCNKCAERQRALDAVATSAGNTRRVRSLRDVI